MSGSVLPQDDSVTEIGTWAFGDNPCLKKIEIFRYIQKIDIMSFYNCGGLEEIVVDKDNPVFHEAGNCLIETQTKTLLRFGSNGKIPSDGSVTGIQDGAFGGCFIRNLYIPACIQSFVISGHGIAGLETVSVEEGNAVYYSSENCLIEKSTQTLCVGCKNSVIPSGVKRIKTGAFEGSEIASINIPVSVTCIESFAFLDCADLTEIRYEGTTEQWNALEKNGSWDKNTGNYVVNCSDGTLIKNEIKFVFCDGDRPLETGAPFKLFEERRPRPFCVQKRFSAWKKLSIYSIFYRMCKYGKVCGVRS